jgi:hypothetical protein
MIPGKDKRVYYLSFIVFALCVVSTPGQALTAFFLYALSILVFLRITVVPAGYVLRKSLALLPAIGLLGLVMFFLKRGMLDRLLAFWNVVSKAYLLNLGAIILVRITGPFGFHGLAANSRFKKEDLRFLFITIIILAEIRLLGG